MSRRKIYSQMFSALGDETRLALVFRLSIKSPQTISELTQDSEISRQAVTKHLQILEEAHIINHLREGRNSLYEFNPQHLDKIRVYVDSMTLRWDEALMRFKSFVEG